MSELRKDRKLIQDEFMNGSALHTMEVEPQGALWKTIEQKSWNCPWGKGLRARIALGVILLAFQTEGNYRCTRG